MKSHPQRAQSGELSLETPRRAPDRDYLTTHQLIDFLQLGSKSAVYRLIREHHMPFTRVGGLYRFDRREIEAWMRGFGGSVEWARAMKRSA